MLPLFDIFCNDFCIFRFSGQPVQQLATHGARAVDIADINGVQYMAIANSGNKDKMYSPTK